MHYSISDLEKYTGVKAHTIRIWEQRYDIVEPHRTDTNIRYYDDDQLRRLLNVASLVRAGMRISKISQLNDDELQGVLTDLSTQEDSGFYARETNALMTSALTYNEEMFHRTFADCMLRYGLEDTYVHVVNPVLAKTGLMWSTGEMDVCQEHFVSNLIRQKLYTAADKLANPGQSAKTWILFLPESEAHDVGLLYANFLIRYYGHRVIYLGQQVPLPILKDNVLTINPDYMLTFLRHTYKINWAQKFIDKLDKQFGLYNPIVAAHGDFVSELKAPACVELVTSPDAIMDRLTSR